ncbi:MAG: fibronectin type III domain-containing protein [Elusimicrobiota bacterium]
MVLRALFFIFFLSWPPASPAAALDFSIATVSATGDTGYFTSLAIDQDGNLHAAYYDADAGEVYYTSRTAGAGWSVPTKILEGDDSAHVSLAIGADGKRHVAFYSADAPCAALCYAVSSDGWTWTPAAVDDAAGGNYAAIALNGAGYPSIAYAGASGEVKYALFDGGAWILETADAAASVLVDLGGDEANVRQVSLALDGAGRPRIAYFDANSTVLKYAARGVAAWGAPETVENTGAVFAGVSLALDGGGEPRISYADYDNGSLRYAARAGGLWSAVEAVAALGPPQIQFSSALGLDGDGDPLIAFNDDDTPALYFAWYTGAAWNSQTVDNDADTAGYFVALAIDAAGNPHIVYGDSQSGSSALKYASATAAGFTPPLGGGPGGKVQAPADFRAQNASSAAITWSWSDNAANELGFELYGAASSTGPFTLIADTHTLGPNVTSFSESELTPNTSYFRYIAAVNAGGVVVSSGSLGLTGRMSAPGAAAAAFTAVSTANFTAHWTRGAGAADTSYIVLASTAADFSVVNASSETWNMFAVLGGLEPATTYYVRAAAFAGASTSSYTNLGSTATLPLILAVPAPFAGAVQGISSIAWSWGNVIDEAGFRVVSSTGGNMSGDLAADVLSFTETGLSTNTLYSRRAVAFSALSYSTSAAAELYTLAAPPTSFAFTEVFIDSITVQWAANTNPADTTTYRVDRWEAGGATTSITVSLTSATLTGLAELTTYYLTVHALNGDNTATASGLALSTATLERPLSPPGQAAAAFTGVAVTSFTVAWTSGTEANTFNPSGTFYIVRGSTAANFSVINISSETLNLAASFTSLDPNTTYYVQVAAFEGASTTTAADLGSITTLSPVLAVPVGSAGAAQGISSVTWSWGNIVDESGFRVVSSTGGNLSGDLAADVLSFTETGLSTNTLYTRRVVAFAGVSYSTSAAAAAYTLAAPPTSFTFVDVFITSMSLQWAANTNSGAATTYRVDRWEAGGATTSVTAGGLSAALTGLAGGTTYYLTVSALNGDGVATASGLELSTVTWPASWSEAALGPGGGGDIAFNLPGGAAAVSIPAGAFAEAVTVTVTAPASFPAAVSPTARLQGTGVGLEITLNKPLQPTLGVLLRVPYLDSEVAGLDQSRLLLARYDVPRGVWVPLVSNADPAAHIVTAVTDHFSTFQLMAAAPGDLSNLKAFPNPLRPALGHRTMKFAGLPAAALLRIYTPLGELVRELTANTAGMAEWDGTNSSGHAAASGAYYVFVKDEGRTRTFGVAVQR